MRYEEIGEYPAPRRAAPVLSSAGTLVARDLGPSPPQGPPHFSVDQAPAADHRALMHVYKMQKLLLSLWDVSPPGQSSHLGADSNDTAAHKRR